MNKIRSNIDLTNFLNYGPTEPRNITATTEPFHSRWGWLHRSNTDVFFYWESYFCVQLFITCLTESLR